MKITAIETLRSREFANIVHVQVETDEGVTGLGETSWGPDAVAAYVHETAAPYLLGKDALQIERHWRALTGFVGFSGTGAELRGRSAIDLALWDLLGKVAGLPVYQLLGGASRDAVRTYNTCAGYGYVRRPVAGGGLPTANWGVSGDGPYEDLEAFMSDAGALAESLLEQGITAMKIWPFDPVAESTGGLSISNADMRRALLPFRQIREAVGDAMDVMLEMHSMWDLPCAIQIARAVEEFEPFWFEDPIRMDCLDSLRRFADATPHRVTASETLATRQSFEALIRSQAVSVVMFDPVWCGGISEARHIVALADAARLPVAPHDCLGPVEFIAALHLAINAPNAILQESVRAFYTGWYNEIVTTVPQVDHGYLTAPEGAGLGTELREEYFASSDVARRRSAI